MKNRNKLIIAAILLWFSPTICDAIYRPVGIIKTLIINSMATVFSSTYDISTPAGSDSPSEADDRMRETKAAVQERLAVEHRFALTGTEVSAADTGEHTDITTDSIVNAGTMTNAGTMGVAGDFAVNTNKFTVTAASGNTLVGGTLEVTGTLDVTGNIDPTTYETTNGGFLDEDAMGSDAANKVASQQSIKAYVDTEKAPAAAVIKGWVIFDGQAANPNSTKTGYNVSSITDSGVGIYIVNWDTNFASNQYAATTTVRHDGPTNKFDAFGSIRAQAAGTVTIQCKDDAGNNVDCDIVCVIAIGTQ